ncbi:hypothetical protein Tco_0991588 [Tanacetum coccineum]|uniref:Uncharacterized protein n=1 Tax=Tanacetum coccineum TaxID=301880 RepID=A0ABQ5F011_9ASTR
MDLSNSSPPKEEKENEPEGDKGYGAQPSTENIQPPVVQTDDQSGEPVVASKTTPTLPYPSRANKEKLREKDNLLASKFVEIFRNLHFKYKFPRDFLMEEIDAFLEHDDSIPSRVLTASMILREICLLVKSSCEDPPDLELKDLPSHLEEDSFPALTGHLPIVACLLGYAMHRARSRCMVAIFHDMIEKTIEVFMDDFSVLVILSPPAFHLDKCSKV